MMVLLLIVFFEVDCVPGVGDWRPVEVTKAIGARPHHLGDFVRSLPGS